MPFTLSRCSRDNRLLVLNGSRRNLKGCSHLFRAIFPKINGTILARPTFEYVY